MLFPSKCRFACSRKFNGRSSSSQIGGKENVARSLWYFYRFYFLCICLFLLLFLRWNAFPTLVSCFPEIVCPEFIADMMQHNAAELPYNENEVLVQEKTVMWKC